MADNDPTGRLMDKTSEVQYNTGLGRKVKLMAQATYKGIVRGKNIVLEEPADLPEGTEVILTPLQAAQGSPQAVLTAMDAPPHVKPEEVEELRRLIELKRTGHNDQASLQDPQSARNKTAQIVRDTVRRLIFLEMAL